jgi:cyclopropane fatty-acyl-phospholipid synthase-like methyltransferase
VTTEQEIPSPEEISDFYDLAGPVMQEVWDDNMHFGYWYDDEDKSSIEEATDRLTDILIDKLGVGPGDRVLDVGCGVGKPAVRLARATGATIVGITISQRQVDQASERARSEGIADQVTFQRADAMDMPFEDASFDAVLAFESIIHMDRSRAMRELARVVVPGGPVVLTDLVDRAAAGAQPQSFAGAGFPTAENAAPLPKIAEYHTLLESTDLAIDELTDITDHTLKYTIAQMGQGFEKAFQAGQRRYGGSADEAMMKAMMPLIGAAEIGYVLMAAHREKPSM